MVEEKTIIKWHPKTKTYFIKLGYIYTKYGEEFEVLVKDLTLNSNHKVKVKCDICGVEKYIKYQDYNKCIQKDGIYRCAKCAVEKQKQTCLEKYGFTTMLQNKEYMKRCIYQKYGVENYSQISNWNEIYKNTCIEKYGTENIFQLDEIKEKSKQTCLKNYGTDFHLQNKNQKEKYLFGENNSQYIDGRSYVDRSAYEQEVWRKLVYLKDNYTCRVCGHKNGNLNAHHILSYDNNIEERWVVENGITLCKKCHMLFHKMYGYGNNNKEQFNEFLKSQEAIETQDK